MEKITAYKSFDGQIFTSESECVEHERKLGRIEYFSVSIFVDEEHKLECTDGKCVVAVCEKKMHEEFLKMWIEQILGVPIIASVFGEPCKNIYIRKITKDDYLSSNVKHYLLGYDKIPGYPEPIQVPWFV